MELNSPIPDFKLPATGGGSFRLQDMRGRKLVIYFYPKDATPGCTLEGQDFRDLYPEFQSASCEIVGISRDGMRSHEKFCASLALPFSLLSDENSEACALFDVIRMKNMYGKQVLGIERSTFVVDANGVLRAQWRGVKVPGHAREVLNFVQTL